MLKLNGTDIENVKFIGVDLDKVIVNGVIVFEKSKKDTIIMRTVQDWIGLTVIARGERLCEVWNAGNKIGKLENSKWRSFLILNKNEDVIIKGEKIISLSCHHNGLSSLNVQGSPALTSLICHSNNLANLNVQGLKALTHLTCSDNNLANLNVQGLKALTYLDCSHNNLANLNVQGLKVLKYLDCSHNNLANLNVQDAPTLRRLRLKYNFLTAAAFKDIFKNLLYTEEGQAVLYDKSDNNYKDFSQPPELFNAFYVAKAAKGWKFYENDISYENLI